MPVIMLRGTVGVPEDLQNQQVQRALDEVRPRIEQVGEQVPHVAVRVAHDDLIGPAVEGPGDGRVRLLRHQLAGPGVVVRAA